ncbi:flagellar biosynthetic protein FliR [Lachnospiraceae bacterium C7]|nr:flagellar biosynthetic protein FliR [Lachnospiraceae bacterium C7]
MVYYSVSLNDLEYFFLILVRIAAFLRVAPLIGGRDVPTKVKAGLAFVLSIMLYPIVDRKGLEYVGAIGFASFVVIEVMTGLLIGFAANICNFIVLFAGNIIDMDIGLSMATEFNPQTNSEVTITGNLYQYLVTLLLIASNMHIYIIEAFSDSFKLIPLGRAQFEWEFLLKAMIKYMCDTCVIGFRIFLPFFACIMILNCVLGIMAKVAPQMNMFAVGMQMKVLVGLAVMFMTSFMMSKIAVIIADEMKELIHLMIEGMH